MLKYYETNDLDLMMQKCVRHDFPLPNARLSIFALRCGRFLSLGGTPMGLYFAQGGVVARCCFATTLIRVFALDAFDSIPRCPNLDLEI